MSHPWHDIPIGCNCPKTFNSVIEIPKKSRLKVELDKDTGIYMVDRVLQSSMIYPANYGFIPQTLAGDGDPLDVLVLGQDPIDTGMFLRCRAIGYIKMTDDGLRDDKIIAVHVNDPAVNTHTDTSSLKDYIIIEMQRFFNDYKKYEHKEVTTDGIGTAEEANRIIVETHNSWKKKYLKSTN